MKLIATKKNIDWAVLLRQLVKDTGCSNSDISNAIGIPSYYVSRYRTDAKRFTAQADQAVSLLLLFLANTERDLPLIGDYFDVDDEPINNKQ